MKFGDHKNLNDDVVIKYCKEVFEYDRTEDATSPTKSSPVKFNESPMIRNERGELVRAPAMDSFDYVDMKIMDTKGLLEYVDSVFAQNE